MLVFFDDLSPVVATITANVNQHDLGVFIIRADEENSSYLTALRTLDVLTRHGWVKCVLLVYDNVFVFLLELPSRDEVLDWRSRVLHDCLVAAALYVAFVGELSSLVLRMEHVAALGAETNTSVLTLLLCLNIVVVLLEKVAHLFFALDSVPTIEPSALTRQISSVIESKMSTGSRRKSSEVSLNGVCSLSLTSLKEHI